MIPNANGCLSISERPDETMMAYQIEDVQINCLDIHTKQAMVLHILLLPWQGFAKDKGIVQGI